MAPFANGDVNVDVYDGSNALLGSAVVATPGFFGVQTDGTISRIVIASPTSQAEGVDNVAFGCAGGGGAPSCAAGVTQAKALVAGSTTINPLFRTVITNLLTAIGQGNASAHRTYNGLVLVLVKFRAMTTAEAASLVQLVSGCP